MTNINELFKVYVSDWAPNGCNDLIFTDSDDQVIGAMSESLFGFNIKPDALGNYTGCLYGESMIMVDSGEFPDYDSSAIQLCHWQPIPMELVLKKLAISPVKTYNDAVKELKDSVYDALKLSHYSRDKANQIYQELFFELDNEGVNYV